MTRRQMLIILIYLVILTNYKKINVNSEQLHNFLIMTWSWSLMSMEDFKWDLSPIMMYLDTVQLEIITFRMVKERVLGVIPVLIQAHSNQKKAELIRDCSLRLVAVMALM